MIEDRFPATKRWYVAVSAYGDVCLRALALVADEPAFSFAF